MLLLQLSTAMFKVVKDNSNNRMDPAIPHCLWRAGPRSVGVIPKSADAQLSYISSIQPSPILQDTLAHF